MGGDIYPLDLYIRLMNKIGQLEGIYSRTWWDMKLKLVGCQLFEIK